MDIDQDTQDAIMEIYHEFGPPPAYTLNPTLAEVLDGYEVTHYQRVLRVWRDQGWACRDDIAGILDKRARLSAIKGIGKVLAPRHANLMSLPDLLFEPVTGIPIKCEEGQGQALLAPPVEG